MGKWLRKYMERMGLDPKDPQQVALAKVRVVYEKNKGGAETNAIALEKTLVSIRARDPGLLETWRVTLKEWDVVVVRKSAVDRLAEIAEVEPS
jgi:hypothetical protein